MIKTTILYDNTDLTKTYPDVRDYLFDTYADERGWAAKEDIPDDEVSAEAADIDRMNWEDFYADLEYIFKNDCYLLTGICGRWNGPAEGGKFIHSASELLDCIGHLDYIKIYDENGCQLVPQAAKAVYDEIEKITDYRSLTFERNKEYIIETDTTDAFVSAVLKESRNKDPKSLSVVYTPIHGSGKIPVKLTLEKDGLKMY